jgi:REP element-mobilizing transposase RayT
MGRGARQDIEGGWHHVMNRGADRERIFYTKGDGEAFESLLAEGSERFGVEAHAYCLMPNHFHLLLHCPLGGLSEYMQRLGSIYSRRINRRLGGDGPRRGLARVISIALLEHCHGQTRMELTRRLEFPSAAAMRTATRRAHLKIAASPELERALQRAIDLLAA